MNYTDYIKRRIQHKENRVPWNFGHKFDTHEFCIANRIPVPELFAKFDDPKDISLRDLPERFVLKPSYSSTSKGVFVLERRGEGRYFDFMSGSDVSADDVVAAQTKIFDSHTKAKRKFTLAEEYLEDAVVGGVPEDYKFMAFQGVIGLIIKINRNGDKLSMSYFDGEFRPVFDERIDFKSSLADLQISETPSNWRRLLDVARRASVIVPSPFARIDLFDTTRGPVLGEITLTPGSFYYPNGHVLSTDENERLGRLWKEAEIRLWGESTV